VTEAGEGSVYVLDPGNAVLAAAPLYRDMVSPEDRLRALARAVAASPGFAGMEDAVVVARTVAPLRLGLVGRLSESERSRVESLPGILESGLKRLRYVTYEEAERVTRRLAERLESEIGRRELSRCRFAALPRGGLFVLGMLAYVLGLRADQIEASAAESGAENGGSRDGPLVLVDDCAFTGLRFVETVHRTAAPEVVFAHLFSHPDLRNAIERREERVRACIAGEDLTDLAESLLGADLEAWRERWRPRSGDAATWIGLPEHLCFPWNEPDISVWNRAREAEEAPWRLVPPEYCLKNRPLEGSDGARLQEQGRSPGPLQPGDSTLVAALDGEDGGVLVADWRTGMAYLFSGVAADAWNALLSEGSIEGATERLQGAWDTDADRLRADVRSVLERAMDLGLLKRESGGRGAGSHG